MQRVKNEKNMLVLFQAKEIGPTTPIIYMLLEAEWITTCLWNALGDSSVYIFKNTISSIFFLALMIWIMMGEGVLNVKQVSETKLL